MEKKSLNICVLTISDTRSLQEDTSGAYLAKALEEDGHRLKQRQIVPDNIYKIREIVSCWIADETVDVVIATGGTGLTGRDSTPEALQPLFDKEIIGFGEAFRWLSWEDVGASTIQSRTTAGLANGTFIFALPGSRGACRLGWEKLLSPQLSSLTKPCNFVDLIPRLREV